uniref:Semaphorin-1A n=1 Tax=Stomoxys calcitrans TaxID=35570 RepID=A0A1I8QBF7_STOCA
LTDHGKIIKSVNAESADSDKKVTSVVIEEIDVLPKTEPIRNLKIVRTMQYDQPKDGSYDDGKLIIVTDSQVIAIQLHRCHNDKITSCSECVALQDPYCAWDKIAGKCRSHGAPRWLEENYYYQNVTTGQHAACPSGKINSKDANVGERPHISPDIINAQYTVETLVMAVLAGSIFSLLVGFFTGYFCGRRCHKDEDDNLPYPDTEYEYFEQRQNVNRIQAEPKLLPQVEEVTYAEPVLLPQPPPKMHSPKSTLRKPMPPHHGPNSETFFQFQPDGYNTQQSYRCRDNFGTLRSHQVMGDNYRRGDGFSTTRSVKKFPISNFRAVSELTQHRSNSPQHSSSASSPVMSNSSSSPAPPSSSPSPITNTKSMPLIKTTSNNTKSTSATATANATASAETGSLAGNELEAAEANGANGSLAATNGETDPPNINLDEHKAPATMPYCRTKSTKTTTTNNTANKTNEKAKGLAKTTNSTTTTNHQHNKLETKRNRHRHHHHHNSNGHSNSHQNGCNNIHSNSSRRHRSSLAKSVPVTPVQANSTTNQFLPSSTDYNDDDDDDEEDEDDETHAIYNNGMVYTPPYSYPIFSLEYQQEQQQQQNHKDHHVPQQQYQQSHRRMFQREQDEEEIFREACSDQHPLELGRDREDDSSSLAMITPPPPYDTPYRKQQQQQQHQQQHNHLNSSSSLQHQQHQQQQKHKLNSQHSAPHYSNYNSSSYASAKSRSDMPPQSRKYLFSNRETFTISSSNGNSSSNSIHQQPLQSTSLAGTLTNAITPTKLSAAAAAMFAAPQMVHLNRKWSNLHRKRRRRNSSSGDSKELDKLVLQSVDWDENDIY